MNNDAANVIRQLADLLACENGALQRLDFSAAVALLSAKEAALASLTQLTGSPAMPANLAKQLLTLAAENQTLLQRAIKVQTRVVRIVARAYAPKPATAHYGARYGRPPSTRSAPVAVSTRA